VEQLARATGGWNWWRRRRRGSVSQSQKTKDMAGETAGNIRSAIELMDQTDAAQAVVTTLVRMVEEKRLR